MKYCILIWDEGFQNLRFWQNVVQNQVFIEERSFIPKDILEESIAKMANISHEFQNRYRIIWLEES